MVTTVPPTGDGATVRRATPDFIDAGHILGSRYEIRRLLGRGAMGEVWLAFDLKLRVEVALKDLTFRRDDREMLRREVRSARDVVSANVCRVFDLVEADGRELLSMEYVDGVTLRNVFEERSPLEVSEAQTIASQLLAGLESIHTAGLVHRDVKPENVMMTRTGRVVIMDFGLARESKSDSASIAGTPAYMSPEQARGDSMDPRTDIFAAGVVLAEMISGARTREARTSIWEGIRRRPIEIPENSWSAVLRRALSRDRAERFASARDMARELEEVTTRLTSAEERNPYPGLAAFTSDQTKLFFGREAEIETMLRKLERYSMLALIGPSGAGKSSFLQAGLLPMLPRSWGVVLCHPGSSPFVSLGQAVAAQLSSDAGIGQDLVRFHEIGGALSVLRRWRSGRDDAVLVIDQFEELFTLNTADTQARFADLLGRAAAEEKIRVLLSLRDDFLFQCHRQEALAPVFLDLTPLDAPAGSALRRALVQPAVLSAYTFEDDALVEQMVDEVGSGRGSLPLLSFAAAQLWQKRDRESGLLTRSAYQDIGGVSGALAQHAESTLERIGTERIPIVREIFRNLVTAQGTRAARDRDELLSVFAAERAAADDVLSILVAARLLTSFENRIEIAHESLLAAWPRLVHWQAQDAEGALLRDHLRQAAHLWHERSRPRELLWTGNAYREFSVWRARYPGGLTAIEEAFARAMVRSAERTRRRTRLSVAAALAIAIVLATSMGVLWRRSVAESQRAEAQKLLAFAQVEMERYPTAALAYITKSLDLSDTTEGRRLMMEALWKGPVARVLQLESANSVVLGFSRDGKMLAAIGAGGPDFLISNDGRPPRRLNLAAPRAYTIGFSKDDGVLVIDQGNDVAIVSVTDGRIIRTIPKNDGFIKVGDSSILVITHIDEQFRALQKWPLDGGEGVVLGTFKGTEFGDLHPSGRWMARLVDGAAYREPIDLKPRELIWRPARKALDLNFGPGGTYLAATTENGIDLFFMHDGRSRWLPVPGNERLGLYSRFEFSPSRVFAATAGSSARLFVWEVAHPDVEALTLRVHGDPLWTNAKFHPAGDWLATPTTEGTVFFWPLNQTHAQVLRTRESNGSFVEFSPDSKWLASCAGGEGARLWSVDGAHESRILSVPKDDCHSIAFDPTSTKLLAGALYQGVYLHHVKGGEPRQMKATPDNAPTGTAFDPSGRTAVMNFASMQVRSKHVLEVVDLVSGSIRSFPSSIAEDDGSDRATVRWDSLAFSANGTLYSAGERGVWRWDLTNGARHLIEGGPSRGASMAMSGDGKTMLAAIGQTATPGEPYIRNAELLVIDVVSGRRRKITTHGSDFNGIGINQSGTIIVTTDANGVVRVSKATGEEPHLLLGHPAASFSVVISPDGRWIASSAQNEIRMWPMPDLSKPPLHLLPHDQLMARLRELTNLRAVRAESASTGYKLEAGPFPGWKNVPTW